MKRILTLIFLILAMVFIAASTVGYSLTIYGYIEYALTEMPEAKTFYLTLIMGAVSYNFIMWTVFRMILNKFKAIYRLYTHTKKISCCKDKKECVCSHS